MNVTDMQSVQRPKNYIRESSVYFMWFTNVCGLVGNLLLLYVFLRRRKLRPHELLILSLATLDFAQSFFIIVQNIFFKKHVSSGFCIVNNLTFHFVFLASCFIVIHITLDRYLAVCRVLYHRMFATTRNTAVIVGCSFLLASVLVVPSSLICLRPTLALKTYVYSVQLVARVLASAAILFSYWRILRKISRASKLATRSYQFTAATTAARTQQSQVPSASAVQFDTVHESNHLLSVNGSNVRGNGLSSSDSAIPPAEGAKSTNRSRSLISLAPAPTNETPRSRGNKSTVLCVIISVTYIALSMPTATTQLMFQFAPFQTVLFSDVLIVCYILSLWVTVANPFLYAIVHHSYRQHLCLS